jgi:hypothetical protein
MRVFAEPSHVQLHIDDVKIAQVPEDFTGLSYETSQLSHPEFFSAKNTALIAFFRTLSSPGVLRLGGNMSEFTRWDPAATMAEPPGETEGPDPGYGSNRVLPVTPRAIANLPGFLNATGWRLIYGLNLACGDAHAAVDEASQVVKFVGDRLIALQFGNEPDLFKHNGDRTRKWTYDEFLAQWMVFYQAIRAELPNVPIAGPDTSNPRWNAQFAKDVGHKVVLETGHFYPEGPPSDPRMNIEYLLRSGERARSFTHQAMELARQSDLPFRLAEVNSCYAAGKPGVSDTFAAALWAADLMLTMAAAGASGVNLHGGASGLYTPIAGSPSTGYEARPIYYGMLLASQFAGATMHQTLLDAAGKTATAYAGTRNGFLHVAVLNMAPDPIGVDLHLPAASARNSATVWRLQAPSIESKAAVRLANARVNPQGVFRPHATERLHFRRGLSALQLAPYSAALVQVR